jgi:hypothetical protein
MVQQQEGMSALGSLEWVLARVPHVGAVNSVFNDVVRTNSSTRAGLNYGTYRAPCGLDVFRSETRTSSWRLKCSHTRRRRRFGSGLTMSTAGHVLRCFIRDADYSRIDDVLRAAERETSEQGLGHKNRAFRRRVDQLPDGAAAESKAGVLNWVGACD